MAKESTVSKTELCYPHYGTFRVLVGKVCPEYHGNISTVGERLKMSKVMLCDPDFVKYENNVTNPSHMIWPSRAKVSMRKICDCIMRFCVRRGGRNSI